MNSDRIDSMARSMAIGTPRRHVLRRILGFSLAGVTAFHRSTDVSANHKDRHCAKIGQRCHRHKDCCGTCGPDGFCLSCAGVVAWVEHASLAIGELTAMAGDATSAVTDMAEQNEFDIELVAEIRATAGAIAELSSDFSTVITPTAATDPLRALLDVFAAMADALSNYLDQIAEESFIETGARLEDAIAVSLADLPPINATIAALSADCES